VVIATGSGQGYWGVWERRFVSNALATLTLVPPIVMLASLNVTHLLTRPLAWCVEGALLAIGTCVVTLFFGARGETQTAIPALLYTVLPLLFWAAVRFGLIGVSLLQLVATIAMIVAARGRQPFSLQDVWSLQMLLAMLSVLALSLAVVVRESRRLQALHSAVLRSIPDALAIVDRHGVIIETNDAWATQGRREERPWAVSGDRPANYLEHVRASGRSPDAVVLAEGLHAVLTQARSHYEMEYSWRLIDDTRWFSVSIVPLSGERRGAVISHADITARKRADAQTMHLRDELARAGRSMTMSMLSAALTHDLSQPLAAILSNAQVAKRMLATDAREHQELDAILGDVVTASRRAATMLVELRSWFKHGHHMAQRLSINHLVIDVLGLLQGDLLRRGITIENRPTYPLPAVKGDRQQLQQVVLNLILNACEAMRHTHPRQRRIVVRSTRCDRGVQLSIEDAGTGFSPERLARAFDPFVRTTPSGCGLGLPLCRSIVQAHDGELTVVNNPGDGATIFCTFPCDEDTIPEAASSPGSARAELIQ